ncbi:5123_t:CDS:1, partial [Funneliformis geosporum]
NISLHLDDVMELIYIIASVFRAKLQIQRCIKVKKDESDDELFLQEITQPPSCPFIPPNTVYLAKITKTLIKDK